MFPRTFRRLEPSRRHDAAFLGKVKGFVHGTHRTVLSGVDRERNLHHHHHPLWLERTLTQKHNPDLPDKTKDKHSETPKETDDANYADNVPMSETPLNDGRDASHIKSKASADAADGVRQRLKFDGEASGMTPDPKRSKETVQ